MNLNDNEENKPDILQTEKGTCEVPFLNILIVNGLNVHYSFSSAHFTCRNAEHHFKSTAEISGIFIPNFFSYFSDA